MTNRREYIRVPVPVSRPLKIAVKNKAFRAVAKRIKIIDISLGGVLLSVPYAENLIQPGAAIDFAILLPGDEICWLTGRAVNVADNTCGVQFVKDAVEQRKISHYVMQREREIGGYTKWGKDFDAEGILAEEILEAIWKEAEPGERKMVLFVSTAAEIPSLPEDRYEVKAVRGPEEARMFNPALIIVDSNNLPFSSYSAFEQLERIPSIRKAPVVVVVSSDHEVSSISIKAGSAHLTFSMPNARCRQEMPNIVDALLNRHKRDRK
ncbi:MAG: PilZ domain-containing protein [Nitrospiraceae bacterium]|nr:PilZ domain-containing protein [Nitrospiraceae bacterium]